MDRKIRLGRQVLEGLTDLLEHTSQVWKTYQSSGPGRVDRGMFDPVEVAFQRINELLQDDNLIEWVSEWLTTGGDAWQEKLTHTIRQAHDLAERCVCRPEGLCFITGEAGLIPRQDLHDTFDSTLKYLESQCRMLQAGCDQHQA